VSGVALRARVLDAARLRERLDLDADAYRLVHSEGDGLPGLVIDRYGATAVCQLFEQAWEPYLPDVAELLGGALGSRNVLVRTGDSTGSVPAALLGRVPESGVLIREGSLRFEADLVRGQKTGFFLDQRENRRRVGSLARGAKVLNLFSYSGGFAVAALAGAPSAPSTWTRPRRRSLSHGGATS